MTTELRAFNAQGEQLYFVPDTDARQFLEFDKVGAAFDRMESTRTAWRWIADGSRFVRNRVASFRMDHEEWTRDDVAQYAQVRAARRARLAAQEAPAAAYVGQTVTRVDYENDGTPAYTGVIDNITTDGDDVTYWVVWTGAGATTADPHGPYAFTATA